MLRMSERHVEALQRWERLQVVTSRLHIGMTNRAYRPGLGGDLLRMAPGAGRVLHGTNRPRRVGLSTMAQQAGKPLVTLIDMRKFRKVFGCFLSRRFGAET